VPSPTLLSDLYPAMVEGIKDSNAQTLETRAPEVWRGLGCWPVSDVWSLGVTVCHSTALISLRRLTRSQLVHWLKSKTLFGPRGKLIDGHIDAWCMAKIIRLVGPFEEPESPDKAKEWRLACGLEASEYRDPKSGEMKPFISLKPLREELEELPRDLCSKECSDFILYLLTLDYKKRPSASEALNHPYVR
jgi:serine/threonine protein kinase